MNPYYSHAKRFSERNENGFTGEFIPLGDALRVFFEKHEDKITQFKAELAWEKVFDDYVKKHTKSLFFNKGVLVVKIDLPSLRNEMLLNKTPLIQQLNSSVGEKLILDMEFY